MDDLECKFSVVERGSRVTLTPKCCKGSRQGSSFRIPGPCLGAEVKIPLHGPSYESTIVLIKHTKSDAATIYIDVDTQMECR